MGQDLTRLSAVLAADDHYPELFRKAFGDAEVTPGADRAGAGAVRPVAGVLPVEVRRGAGEGAARSATTSPTSPRRRTAARRCSCGNCATCHLPPGQAAHFVMNRPLNNGLDADTKTADGGVGDITLNAAELGSFKSPSLRNVEFTAPYMHDGRFATLEEVIDHYSSGVKPHPNLDRRARRAAEPRRRRTRRPWSPS